MTTMTYLAEEQERLDFAFRAAQHFARNPDHATFTAGAIEPGAWFAVRWGMGNDCVLTFRISEEHPVTNYQQAFEAKT